MEYEESKKFIIINPFENKGNRETKSEKWIVLYDIRDPKRLRKVAKIMENYGIRVQKSVFEVFATFDVIQRLRHRVQKVILIDDYVLYINVCEEDWQKQIKYGVKACGYEQKDFEIL